MSSRNFVCVVARWFQLLLIVIVNSRLTSSSRIALLEIHSQENQLLTSETPKNNIFAHPDNELPLNYYWTNKQGVRLRDGPYVFLFEVFEKKMGIKFKYIVPEPHAVGVSKNGTYNGEIGQIQSGQVDISANSYYMTYDKQKFGDFTVPVSSSTFCLTVPRAPIVPFTKLLLLPFQLEVWAAAFGSLLASSVFWYITHLFRKSTLACEYANISDDILEVTRVALTGSTERDPQLHNERVFVGALVLFTLVLSNAYQGQLLGFLTSPPHLPEIDSLEQASRTLQTVYTYSYLSDYFESAEATAALREIRRKMVIFKIDDMVDVLKHALRNGGSGAIVPKFRILFVSRLKELTHEGKKTLHLVPECINSPGLLALLVRKGSPLKQKFFDFVSRVVEGGFFAQWMRAQRHRMDANGLTVPEIKVSEEVVEPNPLGIAQINGAFTFLAVGLAGATAALVVEIGVQLVFRRYSRCDQQSKISTVPS